MVGIDYDVLSVIESQAAKRKLAQLSHGMCLAARQYEVVRLRLLEHEPHCIYNVPGKGPVSSAVEVFES